MGSYTVYRSLDGTAGSFTAIAPGITSTSFDDTAVKKNATYWYYAVAADRAGNTSAVKHRQCSRALTAVSREPLYANGAPGPGRSTCPGHLLTRHRALEQPSAP
ncbi:MAG: hypothetical protein M3198_19090 [Actinomycetota bacterium]|nr:hypothetical protein [Actinomycetota bacterium]